MKKTLLFLALLMGLSLLADAQSHPPQNNAVTLPSNTATARVQMPNLPSQTCTFWPDANNTDCVYVGGPNVTNAAGANPGVPLGGTGCQYPSLSNLTVVPNLNSVFVSTDTDDNVIHWLCN